MALSSLKSGIQFKCITALGQDMFIQKRWSFNSYRS